MDYRPNIRAITDPPELYTERLVLKPLDNGMRDSVFIGLSDHRVRRNMQLPTLDTPEKQRAWWQRFADWRASARAAQWGAFSRETNEYIGLMTIKEIDVFHSRGEMGYSILKEHWLKGYGREGAIRILQYAFEEINLHTVIAMISPKNMGSQKIVQSLGMAQEGHFREIHFFEDAFYDLLQFVKINPLHKK